MADVKTDRYALLLGDCLERLKSLESNSIDALVTDPPAGISFMGKDWDSDKGGSKEWINWLSEVLREVQRVLKPGAHGFIWALPRTSHWTAMAIEWGGLEIRDCVTHLFGSGFPKSLDVSKAIDKSAGEKGTRIGTKIHSRSGGEDWAKRPGSVGSSREETLHAPASAASAAWEGWGTALKPAAEFWWLVRKPISEEAIAANVLKWGTGGINIEVSRVGGVGKVVAQGESQGGWGAEKNGGLRKPIFDDTQRGRFPANLVLSHSTYCVLRAEGKRAEGKRATTDMGGQIRERSQPVKYDGDVADEYDCVEDCPVRILDGQSGQSGQSPGVVGAKQTGSFEFHAGIGGRSGKGMVGGKKDFGGASRFFYTAKPSSWERDAGLGDLPEGLAKNALTTHNGTGDYRGVDKKPLARRQNVHPTVKPFTLMRYLIRMITPPGGTVLDPFMGSGTTGAVAVACGFQFVGIEREPEYLEIAHRRIADVRFVPEPPEPTKA